MSVGPSLPSSHVFCTLPTAGHTGELKLVASGFVNPSGLRFVGHHLWVTDINAISSPASANYPLISSCKSAPSDYPARAIHHLFDRFRWMFSWRASARAPC